MAKNWLVGEAVKAIHDGNKEAIQDIGKRFPLFTAAAAQLPKDNGAVEILNAVPMRVSVRIIETNIRDGISNVGGVAGEEDATATVPAEKAKPVAKPAAKPAKKADDEYESMGAYKLYLLCKEREIPVKSKQDKQVYIDALREADGGAPEPADEGYAAMSPQALYKLCKERGLDVKPKLKQKVYIDALEADDAAAAGGDDEWEDEAEDKKPAAKSKPAKKDEEDDDDEWDI